MEEFNKIELNKNNIYYSIEQYLLNNIHTDNNNSNIIRITKNSIYTKRISKNERKLKSCKDISINNNKLLIYNSVNYVNENIINNLITNFSLNKTNKLKYMFMIYRYCWLNNNNEIIEKKNYLLIDDDWLFNLNINPNYSININRQIFSNDKWNTFIHNLKYIYNLKYLSMGIFYILKILK